MFVCASFWASDFGAESMAIVREMKTSSTRYPESRPRRRNGTRRASLIPAHGSVGIDSSAAGEPELHRTGARFTAAYVVEHDVTEITMGIAQQTPRDVTKVSVCARVCECVCVCVCVCRCSAGGRTECRVTVKEPRLLIAPQSRPLLHQLAVSLDHRDAVARPTGSERFSLGPNLS